MGSKALHEGKSHPWKSDGEKHTTDLSVGRGYCRHCWLMEQKGDHHCCEPVGGPTMTSLQECSTMNLEGIAGSRSSSNELSGRHCNPDGSGKV
jgi:hypothetical protein